MRAKLYQGMTRECLFNRLCHKMPRSGTIDERRDKYPTKFPKHDFTIKVPALFSNFLNFVGPNLKRSGVIQSGVRCFTAIGFQVA